MIQKFPEGSINLKSDKGNFLLNSNNTPLLMEELIFMDIETVHSHHSLKNLNFLNPHLANLFIKYANNKLTLEKPDECFDETSPNYNEYNKFYRNTGALMPEYGKIVCISLNYMSPIYDENSDSFYFENKEVSFVSDKNEEVDILIAATVTIDGIYSKFSKYKAQFRNQFNKYPELWLIGHNLTGFDLPFFKNRCFINGIMPSSIIAEDNKKPWDVRVKDTNTIWRGGYSYTGSSTLDTICAVMGLTSPKEDVSGEMVSSIYYDQYDEITTMSLAESNKIIAKYCEGDNRALKAVIQKIQNLKIYSYG